MDENVERMIAPDFKSADGMVDVEGEDHQRPAPDAENKLGDFIEPANPGFFENGRNVVEMKRMQHCVAVNYNDRQRQQKYGGKFLHERE
jgi:hypothetical protein